MALSAAEVKILLTAQDQASSAIGKVDQSLGKLDKTGSTVSTGLSTMGKALVGVGLVAGAGVAAGFVGAVTAATGFEKTMSGVKAVSGATGEEMAGLSSLALKLGADTSFSASEAAAGMEELVKGGLTIPDVMNGAAAATLDLAAAGGVSIPEAATIAANALAQFNLKGEDMAHVADLIAGAANASALDVGQFRQSLQASGAVAAAVGFSFDDLATGIAVMGKAGITGSDAGTSLKTMMLNLQPATDKQTALFKELGLVTADGANQFFDATGKVKSMAEVAQVLQDSLAGMTDQQKLATLELIFGSDAIRAGAVFAKEGAAGFDEMAASMSKVTAKEVGAERLNNLAGSIEQLKGSIETAAITIGLAFLPTIKKIVDEVTKMVNEKLPEIQTFAEQAATAFTDALPKIATAIETALPVITKFLGLLVEHRDTIAGVATALATLVILTTVAGWVTTAATAFGVLATAIAGASGIIGTIGAIITVLGGPITIIAALIGILTIAWLKNWGDIQGKTAAAVDVISSKFDEVNQALDDFGRGARVAFDDFNAAADQFGRDARVAFDDFNAAVDQAGRDARTSFDGMVESVGSASDSIAEALNTASASGTTSLNTMADQVAGVGARMAAGMQGDMATIGAALASGWATAQATTSGALASMGATVAGIWAGITGTVSGAAATVAATISGAWASAQATTAAAWASIQATVSGAISSAVAAVQGFGASVAGALAGAAAAAAAGAAAIGSAIVQGVVGGIQGGIGAVTSAAAGLAQSALSAARSALGVSSPSKEFQTIGKEIAEGLAIGIEKDSFKAVKSVDDLVNKILELGRGAGIAEPKLQGVASAVRELDRATGLAAASTEKLQRLQGALSHEKLVNEPQAIAFAERANALAQQENNIKALTLGMNRELEAAQARLEDATDAKNTAEERGNVAAFSAAVRREKAAAREVADLQALVKPYQDELQTIKDKQEQLALEENAWRLAREQAELAAQKAINAAQQQVELAKRVEAAAQKQIDALGGVNQKFGEQASAVSGVISKVNILEGAMTDLTDVFGDFKSATSGSRSSDLFGKLPGFAHGGVVPGPVGAPMLAMVHGGEMIVPARGTMPMYAGERGEPAPALVGGSSETNHYHFNGMTTQEVVVQVRELERRRQWHLSRGRRN